MNLEIVVLAVAAMLAGAVNAIAGGGTLITFPILIFFGSSAVVANATSTLALTLGLAGSLYGYRRQFPRVRIWLRRFVPISVLGGLAGGILLTHTDDRIFARMVPFLILFATIVFLAQGGVRRWARSTAGEAHHSPRDLWLAVLFQFGVAIYGGYFGAGIGILMLASLAFIGLTDIHEMNGLKTILGSAINFTASLWFVWAGLIDWPRAIVMTLGATLGYFLGSHYSQQIPQRHVRHIISVIGITISAIMFYRQFGR